MGSASSLGTFVVRDINAMSAMPAQNDSGLWQAWALGDGMVMVQPLDVDYTPKGHLYTLPVSDFSNLLKSLQDTPPDGNTASTVRTEHPGPALEPDSPPDASPLTLQGTDASPHTAQIPDASTYTQRTPDAPVTPDPPPYAAMTPDMPAYTRRTSDVSSYTPLIAPAPQETRYPQGASPGYPLSPSLQQPAMRSGAIISPIDGKRRLRADAPDLLLIWHEEYQRLADARAGNRQPPVPAAYNAGAGRTAAAPGAENARFQASPYDAPQQAAGVSRLPDAKEIQARYAEQAMREEFTLLMESMPEDASDIPLESAMAGLIARDAPFFGRKQKFMFTEFGLALRRKNKCKLALLSHMRALNLAPNDENVLFNVARTEYELGRVDRAVERLDKALQVNPGFTAAAHFLTFLRDAGRQS
ncbi:MAG: hypothetical protein LBQ51_09970 [Desulfovibrio sp.]|nr:hypothetical protein [Desulfovibrio sp.]